MGEAARKEPYPYIVREPEVLGETPIVEGTRIAVRAIAGYYQMGMSVDEILATLSHLTPAQVHSALAYYFDHRAEIEKDLVDASDEEHWRSQVKKHPREGSSPA
jgi:uncharacterized protein (DUF433 family)